MGVLALDSTECYRFVPAAGTRDDRAGRDDLGARAGRA